MTQLRLTVLLLAAACIQLNAAAVILSCEQRCGDRYDRALSCQCNALCTNYNNCCSDFASKCAALASTTSCAGRCANNYNPSDACHCNTLCSKYNNCCPDYSAVCADLSCSGRCGAPLDSSKSCQCNSACANYNDCCADYQTQCSGDSSTTPAAGSPVTDTELRDVTAALWGMDTSRLTGDDLLLALQAQTSDSTSSDDAPGPLFVHVDPDFLVKPTVAAFIALLDNYNHRQGQVEDISSSERAEEQSFLDLLMETSIVKHAADFLVKKGQLSSAADMRAALQRAWFDLYPRKTGGVVDSSGFEHVFVGETKTSGSISGFHSWIQLYLEERAGRLDYMGYVRLVQGVSIGAKFSWLGGMKSMGSVLQGTSPELDLTVYTLCLLTRPSARCPVTLDGTQLSVQTWDVAHVSGLQAGSAYPAI